MKAKILIWDADPVALEIMSDLLNTNGYRVETAATGKKAVELFRLEPADLVIGGIEGCGFVDAAALEEIRSIRGEAELILVSASANIEDAVAAVRDLGAFDYLAKPLQDAQALLAVVDRALSRARSTSGTLMPSEPSGPRARQGHSEARNHPVRASIHQTIVENLPLGLALLDSCSRVLFSNERFDAMFGIKSEKARSCDLRQLMDPVVIGHWDADQMLAKALTGAVASESFILSHADATGSALAVNVRALPLHGKVGSYGKILIVAEDVSQNTSVHGQFDKMDRLCALGELCSAIAHEIRNPLAAISSNAQMLYEKSATDRFSKDLVEIILIGVQRMEKFLKDALDFARPRQPIFCRCVLDKVLCQAMRLVTPQAKQKNIQLDINWSSDVPPVYVDPAQIQQVLVNLLLNALWATPEGGLIKVDLGFHNGDYDDGDHGKPFVLLSVADTGKGIDPEHLEKIFDPFFTTRSDGTGLGLAISHAILKEHNVGIQVKSEVGGGTTFFLKFPVIDTAGCVAC